MAAAKQYVVNSSHGMLFINEHGFVEFSSSNEDEDAADYRGLHNIHRFNLVEYQQTYGELPHEFDILDLGYWLDKTPDENNLFGKYEPPDYKWRSMMQWLKEESEND